MKKLIIIAITSILISLVSQAKNREGSSESTWYNDAQITVVERYRSKVTVLTTQHKREVNAIKDALRAEGLFHEALVGTPETRALVVAYNETVKKLKDEVKRRILALRSIDITKKNEGRRQK